MGFLTVVAGCDYMSAAPNVVIPSTGGRGVVDVDMVASSACDVGGWSWPCD